MINISITDILLIISISYAIMHVSGPFGIISKIKNILLLNRLTGHYFYKLFSCGYCVGFWAGIIVNIIYYQIDIKSIFAFGMIGAIISYMFNFIIDLLERKQEIE